MKKKLYIIYIIIMIFCLSSCRVTSNNNFPLDSTDMNESVESEDDTSSKDDSETPEDEYSEIRINKSINPNKIMDNVSAISSGDYYTLAITKDGCLWAWGNNSFGQLGDGTNEDRKTPVKVMDDVIAVDAGYGHSMAIKSDGSLWAWGLNKSGQLGNGRIHEKEYYGPMLESNPEYDMYIPIKIMDEVISISAGYFHSMVIKADGSLWVWGDNTFYQVGVEYGLSSESSQRGHIKVYDNPIKVMEDVIAINAGTDYSMVIKKDGSLWAWGLNNNGQFGNGKLSSRQYDNIEKVPVLIMHDVISISSTAPHTMFIKSDNSLWACGLNYNGQLGNGIYDEEALPSYHLGSNPSLDSYIPIMIMEGVSFVQTGGSHTVAIKADGSLWAWGWNYSGQLGDGTKETRATPIKIMDDVIAISAGASHTVAIKSDGSLWYWGSYK